MDGRHDPMDFERNRAACQLEVDRLDYLSNTPQQVGVGVGQSLSNLGYAMGQAGQRMDIFSECMHSRGFHEVLDSQPIAKPVPVHETAAGHAVIAKCIRETQNDIDGQKFTNCLKKNSAHGSK